MWQMKQADAENALDIYIYDDVMSDGYDWWNDEIIGSETSAKHFRDELAKYPEAKTINIYINSYGGDVAEGTTIHNQLRRHPAEKIVYIDGFACSIASVIAMAGDRIVMPRNAMMMIHNMWTFAMGNAQEFRKVADDLDDITRGNRQAYLRKTGDKLSESQLIKMMDDETWLTAEDCMAYGLADEFAEQDADMSKAAETLQKMNLSLTQRIQINKNLSAQLRDLIQNPAPDTPPALPPEPALKPNPEPVEPEQNKVLNLFAALGAGKGK